MQELSDQVEGKNAKYEGESRQILRYLGTGSILR